MAPSALPVSPGSGLPHPPGLVLRAMGRVWPGVAQVQAQAVPFALQWRAANTEALAAHSAGGPPLWVVLGDSMSQGLGASTYRGGWVGQLSADLARAGQRRELVNLSVSGARIRDVLEDQLPRLRALSHVPGLLTLLIGSNDLVGRRRRARSVDDFAALLAALDGYLLDAGPSTQVSLVVAALPRRNATAEAIDIHPNEKGYATIARAFAVAIGQIGEAGS